MEIKGKVIAVPQLVTGTGSRGEWQKQSVIIEFGEQYPKKLEISAMKDTAIALGQLKVGQEVNFHINIESRESNGRWFTSVSTWRWDAVGNAPQQATQQADDLPY